MGEELPYYLPPEQGWKKHFEGLIPILILVLIAIVLIGKTTTYLCGVPVLGDVFCVKDRVNIGLLGDFSDDANTLVKATLFKNILDSDGGIYEIYTAPLDPRAIEYSSQSLYRKDIVVIAGIQNLSYAMRLSLGEYVGDGGKIILIGDAGTRAAEDLAIKGWSASGFGDYAPVRLADQGTGDIPTVAITDAILWYPDDEHPVITDYAGAYNIDFTKIHEADTCKDIEAIDILPIGNVIAFLESGNEENYVPAIVERKTGISGGNVIYFDFDPGCIPFATISTIRYLAGRG